MEHICLFFSTAWLVLTVVSAQDYYNVLSSEDFKSFKSSSVPCAVHFITKSPERMRHDWQMKEFLTNFMDAGQYLVDFDVSFATVDCIKDPVKEFCTKETAKNTLFVFRYGQTLTELPMDSLYNVDAFVSNMLHLVLLREVPLIQEPIDLAAMQQRLKGRKDILFAKLLAVGTSEHRAFIEGAFAYSHLHQFVMTTNTVTNMLGPGLDAEWAENKDRVWLLNCKPVAMADLCPRSFYRGNMGVPDFALYLKTLDLQPYLEYKASGGTIFYQRLGIPTAYLYSNTVDYRYHKDMVHHLAQTFRGNLGFVLVNSDKTPESVTAEGERCQPPCLMLQRAPQEPLIQMDMMEDHLTAEEIAAFIEDNMYIQEDEGQDQMDGEDDRIAVQELQDDEVQFAVHRNPGILDTSHVTKLTDKTFPEFITNSELIIVLFTVHWDPRCKAFLEYYSAAAKTLQGDVTSDHPISPLAQVECFNWPDVCQLNNVTTYPTIKMYKEGRMVTSYKGTLSENGILKAYRLYSTANPVVLKTCSECHAFIKGDLPSWSDATLNDVFIGHFPEGTSNERSEYELAAERLQGQQLIGLCQEDCTQHLTGSSTSKPTLTAIKWGDNHQPVVEYTGDYTAGDLIKFVHDATLPLVPELTPSTFPLHFARGKPFLILFKDTDDQSKEAEASLASLALERTFESELVILWIDVSQPSCIGSEILRDYGIKRQPLHPNIVFVDHTTNRVCNYPPDYSLKASAMADWVVIVLNGETTCSGLREDEFEPQVSPYDFLAFIQENNEKVAQRMSRLAMDHHHAEGEEEEEQLEEGREGRGRLYVSDAYGDERRHTEL